MFYLSLCQYELLQWLFCYCLACDEVDAEPQALNVIKITRKKTTSFPFTSWCFKIISGMYHSFNAHLYDFIPLFGLISTDESLHWNWWSDIFLIVHFIKDKDHHFSCKTIYIFVHTINYIYRYIYIVLPWQPK